MSNWFLLAHLLGAVQGFFLAAILASKRQGSVATRILAALMLTFSLDLTAAVYHASGYDAVWPHGIGLDYPVTLLYGPLFYLYIHTLSRRERTFRSAYLWHFLPFAVLVLVLMPFYLQDGAAKLAVLQAPGTDPWQRGLRVVNHLKVLHALVYLALALRLLLSYRRRLREASPAAGPERLFLTWLRYLIIGFGALGGVSVLLYILSQDDPPSAIGQDPTTTYDDYTWLGIAVFVYTIGFLGLRQPAIFDAPEPSAPPHRTKPPSTSPADATDPEKPRYAKSGMDPETAARYRQALLHLMATDRPYRRGDLTLQELSDALSISPHNLTEVINTQLEQHFYDFVNSYRVREVQERLADPEAAHLTLLAIGMDAGFNSKSSFNAVFKKHTGMTPSQYRKRVRAEDPA